MYEKGNRPLTTAGAVTQLERQLTTIADILDSGVDPGRLSTDHLAYAATVAIHRLREWGIHPGQRDADGLPVSPPHDDNCQVCGGDR